MELHEAPSAYEKIIHYDKVKDIIVKLTVNTFYGTEYLHIRKYYRDFETEDWMPSNEGVAMALDFDNSRNLFIAIAEIMSLAETKEIIEETFGEVIKDIYTE
jgi:hypothetical protein